MTSDAESSGAKAFATLLPTHAPELNPQGFAALAAALELTTLAECGEHERVRERAAQILEELRPDDDIVATGCASIASLGGNSSMAIGQPATALRFATIELACAQAVTDGATLRARALNNLGSAEEALGRLAEATRDFEAALQALAGPDEDGSRATLRRLISYHLADVRTARDEPAEDVTPLLHAGAFITAAPGLLTSTQLAALNARAWALGQSGRHEEALEILERTRQQYPQADDRILGVFASNIGMEHLACGRIDDAIRELEDARALHSRSGCQAELATDCFNLAEIVRRDQRVDDAGRYLVEAWTALRDGAVRSLRTVQVLGSLASIRIVQKDRRRARAAAEKALEIYEGLRPGLAEDESEHSGPLRMYRQVLELLLYLTVDEGWFSDAVALVERGKGRFWHEEVARISGGDPAKAELGFRGNPDALSGGWEMRVRSIAGPDTIVLSFLTGVSATFRIASLNGRSQVRRLDVGEEELQELIDEARYDCMASGSRTGPSDEGIRGLAMLVLGDLTLPFDGARSIIVLPDGPLWTAPFDALTLPGHPEARLIDVAPLSIAPSLQILRELQEQESAGVDRSRIIVVADPEVDNLPALPGARAQLEAIRGIVKHEGVWLAGREATKEQAMKAMKAATGIHFATHAMTDSSRTQLVLSDGNGGEAPLQASDIQSLDLRGVNVVFLSACGTSIGRPSTGEGMASLARAFLFAGARCVISTLWPIADSEALEITRSFYVNHTAGSPAMRAAHEARVFASERLSRRTWASLQLVGDGDSLDERNYWTVRKM